MREKRTHNVVYRSSDDVNSVRVWPHNSQVVLQVNRTGISRPDRVHSAKFRVHHTTAADHIYVNLLHVLHGQEVGDPEEHCHQVGTHTSHEQPQSQAIATHHIQHRKHQSQPHGKIAELPRLLDHMMMQL